MSARSANRASQPQRVLVANRGEIALRIIRAAHALGWETVAIHSDADADSHWVAQADASVHVGPSPARKSYLDIAAVIDAAKNSQCGYVHPGYGFLAESPEFAERVAAAGLVFVGPSATVIESMGNKVRARQSAEHARVPVVPGTGSLDEPEAVQQAAAELAFPLMVKAAAGGGGKGIRVVTASEELSAAISAAQAEAQAAFGDGAVYLEQVISPARHIEVQILADTRGNVVHLFERDCSIQRRRQKLIEEAPATGLSDALRAQMTAAAVRLAADVGYQGAGTVEFLVQEDRFYFLEMNTRIQVEHPITEMVTGVDLVAEQLRIAAGAELSMSQDNIKLAGAAMEFRINAEDPEQDFFPSPGPITRFDLPEGAGIRVDSGFVAGGEIAPYYDSMLAKIIVHGRDRAQALARARQALSELAIEGIKTTQQLHLDLLRHPDVQAGHVATEWLEQYLRGSS